MLAKPQWLVSSAVEAAYGFKDNLLLSSIADERSAFVRGGAEVFVVGVSPRWDASFFVQGKRTHYFSGRTVDHDTNAYAHAEFAYRILDTLKVSLPVIGAYSDDVFDVSETEVDRTVAELETWSGRVAPAVRWDFSSRGWIEAQAGGERKRYAGGGNDARNGDGRLRVGWRLGRHVELQALGGRRWRNFDRRVQVTASGRERPDTHLKVQEREVEGRLETTWGADRNWRTSTRAGRMDYRDNGFHYFDYRRKRVSQDVEWKSARWLVRFEGSAERMTWDVQKIGVGVAPPARIKDGFGAELRVERTLSVRWAVVADYRWERNRSNDEVASYRVNEGLLGARWSWEK